MSLRSHNVFPKGIAFPQPSFWLLLLYGQSLFQVVNGLGIISVRVREFTNPDSMRLLSDGSRVCCDPRLVSCDKCDPYFKLCAGENCKFGLKKTGILNDIVKENYTGMQDLGNGVKNPVIFTFSSSNGWKNHLDLRINVYDYDYVVTDHDLIDSYYLVTDIVPEPFWLPGKYYWKSFKSSVSSLNIEYSVHCAAHYYTTDCSVFCLAPAGQWCNPKTGQQCPLGWYGPACACKPQNDSTAGYTCDDFTGAKICLEDWYGENCTVFCKEDSQFVCDNTTGAKTCRDGSSCVHVATPSPSSTVSVYFPPSSSITVSTADTSSRFTAHIPTSSFSSVSASSTPSPSPSPVATDVTSSYLLPLSTSVMAPASSDIPGQRSSSISTEPSSVQVVSSSAVAPPPPTTGSPAAEKVVVVLEMNDGKGKWTKEKALKLIEILLEKLNKICSQTPSVCEEFTGNSTNDKVFDESDIEVNVQSTEDSSIQLDIQVQKENNTNRGVLPAKVLKMVIDEETANLQESLDCTVVSVAGPGETPSFTARTEEELSSASDVMKNLYMFIALAVLVVIALNVSLYLYRRRLNRKNHTKVHKIHIQSSGCSEEQALVNLMPRKDSPDTTLTDVEDTHQGESLSVVNPSYKH